MGFFFPWDEMKLPNRSSETPGCFRLSKREYLPRECSWEHGKVGLGRETNEFSWNSWQEWEEGSTYGKSRLLLEFYPQIDREKKDKQHPDGKHGSAWLGIPSHESFEDPVREINTEFLVW